MDGREINESQGRAFLAGAMCGIETVMAVVALHADPEAMLLIRQGADEVRETLSDLRDPPGTGGAS